MIQALFLMTFVGMPAVPADAGSSGPDSGQEVTRMIFDFRNPQDAANWFAINDGVMGGISDGQVRINDRGTLEFFGAVSLENNGGFASVRSRTFKQDLAAFDGLVIRVRGDGKRYALTLQTNVRIMAGSYRVKFDTKADEWQEIRVSFADFQATSFGRVITAAPSLDSGEIRSFGFLIADKQAGPFKLEVDWIKAVSESGSDEPDSPGDEARQ
jgi:monofunctional biosynthetic peptidoglycan transglycosylase